jgi:collagenase-like PrtC family protease
MALSIPINFEQAFFDKIDFSSVEEVYGRLPVDAVGGGRPSITFYRLPRSRFAEYVGEAHRRGIRFNYLLNATCIDNREFTKKGHRAIRKLLDFISSLEIPVVTVVLPSLAAIIRHYYPRLKINVSTNALVDRLEKVRYWEETFGVERITLCHTAVNRNFPELRRIMLHKRSCEIQLLCNLLCKRNCALQGLHANFQSHASQNHHRFDLMQADYFCLACSAQVFLDPEEIIRAGWIRPEDLPAYEKIGIRTFKLAERGLTTDALARIVKAYTERHYPGNLADLVPSDSKYRFISERKFWHFFKYYFRPTKINPKEIAGLLRMLLDLKKNAAYREHLGLVIDNGALDSFIDFFVRNDCHRLECGDCGYCASWAAKTITKLPPPQGQDNPEKVFAHIIDQMISDELYA